MNTTRKKLDELKAYLQARQSSPTASGGVLPLGLPGIDGFLPWGGLPLGALHEAGGAEGDGAATGFVAALLARLASRGPVAWVAAGTELYGLGLHGLGLDPARLILIEAAKPRDRLWAFEEMLRSRGLAAIAAELSRLDLTATRRLQLAAESSGTLGFVLRGDGLDGASAARTRWRVTALASSAAIGIGPPRWRIELLRCRGGRPGAWTLAWGKEGWHEESDGPAHTARDRGVAALPRDRQAGAVRPLPVRRTA